MVEYCQHQRSGTGNGSTSACNCLHREWFNWVQAAKQHNTENGADIASIKQRELVERTPFPSFGGSQKGWENFKTVFQEMISLSGHVKAQELAQLAANLPMEARLWVEGVAEPEQEWRHLDKKYGDKDLDALSTMYRLELLKLLQGPARKKIKRLASELRIPRTRLKAIGFESELYASCLTIGRLVNRLDQPVRAR